MNLLRGGRHRPTGGGGGGGSATFIAASIFDSATNFPTALTVPALASASNGDLCVIWANNGSSSAGPITFNGSGGGTSFPDVGTVGGYQNAVQYKVLTTADISDGTISASAMSAGAPFIAAIYRGATVFTTKSFADNTAGSTSLALTGFTPDAATKGVVILGGTSAGGSNNPPSTLTSYTARIADQTSPNNGWFFVSWFDRLSGYTNSTVTVTGFTGSSQPFGFIGELT